MTVLRADIQAYENARAELEAGHVGEWAVFYSGEFVGVFPLFEEAATVAVDRFGSGPYLIRQVGVETIPLSSTMVFRPSHASSSGRL